MMNYFLYAVYTIGLFVLFSESLSLIMRRIKLRHRLQSPVQEKDILAPASEWLGRLASVSFGKDVNGSLVMWSLVFLFLLIFFLAMNSFTPPTALLVALISASAPVLLMYIRLMSEQGKSSREGIAFVSEMYRQYRACGQNMSQAMERALENSKNFPLCARHTYRLLLHLRAASGPGEIRAACAEFSFALGTVWGSMLSSCIRISEEKGLDISEGLGDIVVQLKSASRRAEERKRLNSEANRMTTLLIPILYIGTVGVSISYLGLSPSKFFSNQFLTPEGLLFFMVGIFLFIVNLAVLSLVSGSRLDY